MPPSLGEKHPTPTTPLSPRLGPALALWLAGLLASASPLQVSAADGWQWLDDTGRKVFSDLPPPASVPERRILRRPGMASGPLVVTPVDQGTSAAPARTPAQVSPAATASKSGTGSAPDAKTAAAPGAAKGAAADTEAERQAQDRRNAEIRADNCQRARSSLATLESGTRLMTSNAQGEQVPMEDAARGAEIARMQQAMRENCR